ncbi:hypothetical protein K413DRAFT_4610 [Clostridium sp. ASBs410]|nr:hypothetical protein K413DRAFT_4610 [Clostridium sp. ASBs410]
MEDILGRKLHDGDVCVGKGTGRNVRGMDIGVWSGKSIAFKGGNKRSMGDVFLVVKEEELAIKKEIEYSLQKIENKRQERDSMNTIPLSKLEVGGIYKCTNGHCYVYLGKRKVTLQNLGYYQKKEDVQEGHCFVFVCESYSDEEVKESILSIGTYHGNHSISVLKGGKKLTDFIRKADLQFPMENEEENHSSSKYSFSYHYKLIVE